MAGNLTAMIAAIFSGSTADPYFEYTTLLLPGNGTNGAQNNTFLDGSTNNFTITRNGNTTQGTFSPFSQTGWGNYFDGTANGSLRADSTTDTNLSGDFTIQAWVYPTANGQSSDTEIISRGAAATLNGWHFGLTASTTQIYFGLNYGGTGASVYTKSSTNIPLNQWTHVAVTRSGNTCRIYINGVVDTTNTGFTGTPTVSGTEYVYVGRGSYDSTNRQFTGYINNASIIKGTALTTFSQTQPLATGTSGQALLTCTANRFIDTNTATTAKTLTAGSGASVVAFSPFNPTASWSAATYGGSGYFDGSGDYLTSPNNTAVDFGSGSFTVETWFYPAVNITDARSLFSKRANASVYAPFVVEFNASMAPIFYFSTTGSSWNQINSSVSCVVNAWNHVAITRNGSTFTIWINGVSGGTTTNASALMTNTDAVSIGAAAADGSRSINGYMSSVRMVKGTAVYTAAFTPPTAPLTAITNTSLLLNFTNAGIYDATSKNDLETLDNTVNGVRISTTQFKFGGSSIYFDGTGTDYLWIQADQPFQRFGTAPFTIELWIRLAATGSARGLVAKGTSTTGWLVSLNTSNQVVFTYGTSTITSTGTISQDVWTYIAVVREGTSTNQTKIYIGGVNDGTGTVSTDFTQTSSMYIGANRTGGDLYSGYIQDVRITNGYARTVTTVPTSAFPTL